ncbi:MAG: asparagine synthase-related protein [Candidatus Cloacimonetes bacterium]|jgi:asparagine synthase (glutamine-hydrolysing)|nr:asparagine synthase-related protein [Candidatus Cloacimonadota bacterium]MDD2506307.1 asparagine synthase-related protein [Candidatus Cloacimonadota bacterium]MDD4559873.1 asparagine synthase-related protein [Candidatus Cloacimonadota bacterium]
MIKSKSGWEQLSNLHFIGYLYDDEGNKADLSDIFQRFSEGKSIPEIEAELQKANGCFAMVIEGKDYVLAAVDRIRSIPLFWDCEGNVADSSEALHHLDIDTLKSGDPMILAEFLMTGYVCRDETLDPNVKQIPAASYLLINKGEMPRLQRYYTYVQPEVSDSSTEELCQRLHVLHQQAINRLIHSLEGRPAVIPLSGGYDSRLIAYLLKQAQYPKIFCFTYDAKTSPEVRISQKVAKYLQIPWIFAEHSRDSWFQVYFSEERKQHYKHAVNAVSSAHIQDWHAVRDMQKKGLIPADSVFIPGHSADLLQGAHMPPLYMEQESFSDAEIIGQISKQHYSLWRDLSPLWHERFAQRIKETIDIPKEADARWTAMLCMDWNICERQAKFIVNSVRVYEYFGYQWCLPLWDAELMDFWAKVPLHLLVGRKLWYIYRQKYLPIPLPAFRDFNIPMRIRNKLLRIVFGEIMNIRYGRFAPYRNPIQYASEKVNSYLRDDLQYPDFIDPRRPLLRCQINAIQALRAIYEL